jgi:D-galactarolactone cycloisomerase
MKIIDAKVYILCTVLEKPFYFSQGWVRQRNAVLLEVITNEGVVGWGEALCHGLQPPEIAASILNDCYIPMILGRSPLETNVLWEEMYNRTRPFGQGGAAVNALSAV